MFEEENKIIAEYERKIKSIRISWIVITIIAALFMGVVASEYTIHEVNKQLRIDKVESSIDAKENINSIAKSLKSFRGVIDSYFIGEIDEKKVLDETIKGYVKGLGDEYSEYMTADEWEDFQADTLGNYVGIGVYISQDKAGNIIVLSVIKGTPAEAAGLQKEDIIVSVDETSTVGLTPTEVSALIKGEEGTKAKLSIYRNEEFMDFEIERKNIKIYHVETEMLDNNIGYMALFTFDEGCADEFKTEYLKLKAKGAKKIIIDLRNNTGGLVDEALKIVDMMLPKGATELITVDAKGNKDYTKSEKGQVIDCEAVVLCNGYSASASEITIGALMDNERVKTVGTKTYGKGVIQTVFMLDDGSALKLTVQEYYTPNETKINKVGITPDYEVELDKEADGDEQLNKAIELLK